jgi:hypothetical protein
MNSLCQVGVTWQSASWQSRCTQLSSVEEGQELLRPSRDLVAGRLRGSVRRFRRCGRSPPCPPRPPSPARCQQEGEAVSDISVCPQLLGQDGYTKLERASSNSETALRESGT